MVFNGHTIQDIDALDEATMNEIIVMYSDGVLGNNKNLVTMGTLTSGVFNYMRPPNSKSYTLKEMLGSAYNYIYREEASLPNESLLAFISQAPGFNIDKFKGK
jgi:hypothetical protein